ncbi:hypothetical protein MMC25_005463 [Agyrium rufum]|nr:hypothetical protein [Agyrium rufum]
MPYLSFQLPFSSSSSTTKRPITLPPPTKSRSKPSISKSTDSLLLPPPKPGHQSLKAASVSPRSKSVRASSSTPPTRPVFGPPHRALTTFPEDNSGVDDPLGGGGERGRLAVPIDEKRKLTKLPPSLTSTQSPTRIRSQSKEKSATLVKRSPSSATATSASASGRGSRRLSLGCGIPISVVSAAPTFELMNLSSPGREALVSISSPTPPKRGGSLKALIGKFEAKGEGREVEVPLPLPLPLPSASPGRRKRGGIPREFLEGAVVAERDGMEKNASRALAGKLAGVKIGVDGGMGEEDVDETVKPIVEKHSDLTATLVEIAGPETSEMGSAKTPSHSKATVKDRRPVTEESAHGLHDRHVSSDYEIMEKADINPPSLDYFSSPDSQPYSPPSPPVSLLWTPVGYDCVLRDGEARVMGELESPSDNEDRMQGERESESEMETDDFAKEREVGGKIWIEWMAIRIALRDEEDGRIGIEGIDISTHV